MCIYCTNVRTCNSCADRLFIRPFILELRQSLDLTVKWHRWERTVVDGKTRLSVKTKTSIVWDLLDELQQDLEHPTRGCSFFQHIFTAHSQFSQFKLLKTSLQPGQVLLIMDFAENRKATFNKEIKAAHYGKNQITLHPIVAFYKDSEDNLRRHEIMYLTDDISHDFHAVNHFTLDCLNHMRERTAVTDVILWSDGCAAQYKGKGTFADLSLYSGQHIQRCYFGSEHGKGEANGATGVFSQALKRSVAGGESFADAKSMCSWAKQNLEITDGPRTRTFILVSPEEIRRDRPETSISTLPGSRTIHQVIRIQDYVLKARKLSCFCSGCQQEQFDCCINKQYVGDYETYKLKPSHPVDLNAAFVEDGRTEESDQASQQCSPDTDCRPKLGDFVRVTYISEAGKIDDYHGVVVAGPVDEVITVKFLRRRGTFYVYPDVEEVVPVSSTDRNVEKIERVEPPIVSGRGHHYFY